VNLAVSNTGSLLVCNYFGIHLWNGWPIHTVSFDEFLFGFIVNSIPEVFITKTFDISAKIINDDQILTLTFPQFELEPVLLYTQCQKPSFLERKTSILNKNI